MNHKRCNFFLVPAQWLLGVALWSFACHCMAGLQAQAAEHVREAVLRSLPEEMREHVQLQVDIQGMRGAAAQDCATPWEMSPVDTSHWSRVHVPLRCGNARGSVVARVQLQAPTWVTVRDLPQGHRLQPEDLTSRMQQVHKLDDVRPLQSLTDWVLKRPLPTGSAPGVRDLQRPLYARKGDKLEIRAEHAGITVSAQAIAPRAAYQGETLRVRNVHSNEWVSGVLIAPGVLQASAQRSGGVKVVLE